MSFLVDSNLLLRIVHPADPQHKLALDAVAKLLQGKVDLYVVPQVFYEFWVVATRPTQVNGLGLTAVDSAKRIANFKRTFILLDEIADYFHEWEQLVISNTILGKSAHDTRLVAAMVVHNITHLLTFNQQDFQRFSNITALTPADVLAMP